MLESFVTMSSSEPIEREENNRVRCWSNITMRIRNGDPSAFAEFYEQTFDVMHLQIRRLINCDEQTSLDIIQNAMVKSIRSMKQLPDESSVNAWASAVAKSTAYDWLRKRARLREVDLDVSDTGPSSPTGIGVPESDIELDARLRWVESELQSLPGDLQKMIAFRFRLGWSLRRIAEKFGLKTGAVDGRIRRAVENLRTKAKREHHD